MEEKEWKMDLIETHYLRTEGSQNENKSMYCPSFLLCCCDNTNQNQLGEGKVLSHTAAPSM